MTSKPQSPKKPKKDNRVEMAIHPNWLALISYCGIKLRNGTLCFGTQGANPMNLIQPPTDEDIKFGLDSEEPLFIKELSPALVTVRVTKKWKGLIDFTRESFPYGQVTVLLSRGEPYELVKELTSPIIRFDHPESFPPMVRLFKTENANSDSKT